MSNLQVPKPFWVGQFQAIQYEHKDNIMRWEDGDEWAECKGYKWVKADDFNRLYDYAIALERMNEK